MTEILVVPVSPTFGGEVQGINLAQGVNAENFTMLHEAWLDRGALPFKAQSEVQPIMQVDFGRTFGPLHTHPAAPAEHDHAAIFVIRTHRDSPKSNGNG